MTKKADFNADEWATVVEGPLLAGMRVVASTRGGTIRESLAIGRVYQEARQAQGESALLDEIVSSPPAVDPQKLQSAGDIAAASSERLREALALVAEKGTAAELDAYKSFVVTVAQAAAEAHKEGGFAGNRRKAGQRGRAGCAGRHPRPPGTRSGGRRLHPVGLSLRRSERTRGPRRSMKKTTAVPDATARYSCAVAQGCCEEERRDLQVRRTARLCRTTAHAAGRARPAHRPRANS